MHDDKKRAPETAISETQINTQCVSQHHNYITDKAICQDIISIPKDELERITPKKELSVSLGDSYMRLGYYRRAEFVYHCGEKLQYMIPIVNEQPQKGKLIFANFCKDRLCPLCAYRKTKRIFNQLSSIMDVMGNEYRYLMLTLTIPNVNGHELPRAIDRLMKGIDRLFKRTKVKKAVKGYFRALEVTRNDKDASYHPHYHFILAVKPSYLKNYNDEYITHAEWLNMWRDAMDDPSITQIDIRVIKPSKSKKKHLYN